jgi:actin-related protein
MPSAFLDCALKMPSEVTLIMADGAQALVIDSGSGMCKAGFAGQEYPRCLFLSVVGHPKYLRGSQDTHVGDEACARAGVMLLKFPVNHGVVTNWGDMEKLWYHMFFNQLLVDPAEHPVLLTEAPLNPEANREKMMQLQFETFTVPSFYVENSAVLSMLSCGDTTGVVLDVGDGVTAIVPFYEGYLIPPTIMRSNFAGGDLTELLIGTLKRCGYRFTTSYGVPDCFSCCFRPRREDCVGGRTFRSIIETLHSPSRGPPAWNSFQISFNGAELSPVCLLFLRHFLGN